MLIKYLFFLLQIFTEDATEVENLPRERVLEFLETTAKELVIDYLVSRPTMVMEIIYNIFQSFLVYNYYIYSGIHYLYTTNGF